MSKKTPDPIDVSRHSNSFLPEITLRGIILGALITVIFTASNVYLGLKVGLTFSSSIPSAVISMAVLSFFAKSNILENNMVQTQASAAGTLSAVIFVLPAILMIGYWQGFHFLQTFLICAAGGALGVLFSIPLRRTMVVNSNLPYPEGVAAAEILRAGHDTKTTGSAGDILLGGLLASLISFFTEGLRLLSNAVHFWFSQGKAISQIPMGFSLALVSAGYLMGFGAGIAMLIGVILAWGVFVPVLTSFLPVIDGDIADVATEIWRAKVRFIGAGALAIASIWTLITLLKPMIEGVKLSFDSLRANTNGHRRERTDLDLSSLSLTVLGAIILVLLIGVFYSFVESAPISPYVAWGLVVFSTVVVFIIGFFIASACGYMAGLVGSSNSPISGIGIVAIIIVSVLLVFIGESGALFSSQEGQRFGMALAIFTTTAIVSVACISNDNLQDLKTGFLVGATPKNQQIALLIGCVVGAAIIAPVLGVLYQAYGFSGAPLPRENMDISGLLSAPQASLMMTVTKGIFARNLDWDMFLIGLGVGLTIIAVDLALAKTRCAFRIPALAVGLAIYLPAEITMAIFVGSILNLLVKSHRNGKNNKRGVLIASGFIVGESLTGVAIAIAVLLSLAAGGGDAPFSLAGLMGNLLGDSFEPLKNGVSLLAFLTVCAIFYRKSTSP